MLQFQFQLTDATLPANHHRDVDCRPRRHYLCFSLYRKRRRSATNDIRLTDTVQ